MTTFVFLFSGGNDWLWVTQSPQGGSRDWTSLPLNSLPFYSPSVSTPASFLCPHSPSCSSCFNCISVSFFLVSLLFCLFCLVVFFSFSQLLFFSSLLYCLHLMSPSLSCSPSSLHSSPYLLLRSPSLLLASGQGEAAHMRSWWFVGSLFCLSAALIFMTPLPSEVLLDQAL